MVRPFNPDYYYSNALAGTTAIVAAIVAKSAIETAALTSGGHAHVVGEPFVGDASQTVFYLANEAELDTVAAYDKDGNRVAITQDTTQLDKITFGSAPAAGTGWIDYVLAM